MEFPNTATMTVAQKVAFIEKASKLAGPEHFAKIIQSFCSKIFSLFGALEKISIRPSLARRNSMRCASKKATQVRSTPSW
jgi:hypothetical protein